MGVGGIAQVGVAEKGNQLLIITLFRPSEPGPKFCRTYLFSFLYH